MPSDPKDDLHEHSVNYARDDPQAPEAVTAAVELLHRLADENNDRYTGTCGCGCDCSRWFEQRADAIEAAGRLP